MRPFAKGNVSMKSKNLNTNKLDTTKTKCNYLYILICFY